VADDAPLVAASLYGVLIGIALFVFTKLVPQPIGSIILWALFAMQLSWGAVICWRRTGLPFVTAAFIEGAIVSACAVILAGIGHPFPAWPVEWLMLFAGAGVLAPVLLFIESRVNRVKWQQWAHRTSTSS
jgi:hypothetical protein